MTSPITITVEIHAPLERVWQELACIEDHVEWMADAVAIDFLSEQHTGLGTTFRCATKIGFLRTNDLMTIDQWEEGHRIGVTHSGAVTGTGVFELAGADTSTTVTWTEVLKFPWWMAGAIGAWCARPIFHWIWRRNLEALRSRIAST